MSEKVVVLHPIAPLGHYLRVGNSGHRQLEVLLSSGRLHLNRFVFDASMVGRQRELIGALADRGAELILDTNVAELSVVGRFSGAAKYAPWANPQAVLTADDLGPSANRDVIGQIARFAVEEGFHAVLAPCHFLRSARDTMFQVDLKAVVALREALDKHGGKHIGIDYSLIIPNSALRDPIQRRALISDLATVPYDNLWLRVSAFGADISPPGLRKYVAAVIDFHRLTRPIVADGVGGLAGLATMAFGATGGVCHGVAEKERFNGASWNKPPAGRGRGHERGVLVEKLDRLLSRKQMTILMGSPGARREFSCGDPSCCPRGLDDTMRAPKAHYLRQRHLQVEDLSRVPDVRRADHFLERQLGPVKSHAQQASKLEIQDATLAKALSANSERLEKAFLVLTSLRGDLSGEDRSAVPIRRQKRPETQAQSRR